MTTWTNLTIFRTSERVELENGTAFLTETAVHRLLGPDGPHLSLFIGVSNGRPVLDRLEITRSMPERTFTGPEVTASMVHKLPLESIMQEAIEGIARAAATERGDDPMAAAAGAAHARTRRALTDSLLHQVANVARANPMDPTKQVSEQLYTSHRNATRWIKEAKARGFLASDNEEQP